MNIIHFINNKYLKAIEQILISEVCIKLGVASIVFQKVALSFKMVDDSFTIFKTKLVEVH